MESTMPIESRTPRPLSHDEHLALRTAMAEIGGWIDGHVTRLVGECRGSIRRDFDELSFEVESTARRDRASREELVRVLREFELMLSEVEELHLTSEKSRGMLEELLLRLVVCLKRDLEEREDNWDEVMTLIDKYEERAQDLFGSQSS